MRRFSIHPLLLSVLACLALATASPAQTLDLVVQVDPGERLTAGAQHRPQTEAKRRQHARQRGRGSRAI